MEHVREMTDLGEHHGPEGERLASYAFLSGVFAAALGGALANAARNGRLPERVSIDDVVLAGTAAHKVSRIVSRNRITSFLRAPFTRYDGPGQINEVNEEPRGGGLRRSIGELLACPLCTGTWVSGAFVTGLVYAPRFTRSVTGVFSALAVSDFLHLAFGIASNRYERSAGDA